MKLAKIAALAALMAVGLSGTAMAQTLRLAHAAPDSDLQQTLAEYFAEQVSERTNGEVTVQIFPNGQLGNDQAMIDGTRSGIVDIVISGLNNFTGLIPEAGAFELPYMFPDRQTAYEVLDGEVGDGVLDRFEEFGLKGLGYPENGYRNMTNNRGPIREPGDVSGLRMRVNNSKALNDMFQLLGASPQQLPVAELYTALESGVVDAQDHPIGIVLSFAFYEVQDYLSLTQHAYAALAMAMNLDRFEGLSEENRQIVEDVAQEAVEMQRELSIAREEEMLAELEANGMEINRDVDAAAFQEAVRPVWDQFISENGQEIVDRIEQASAN